MAGLSEAEALELTLRTMQADIQEKSTELSWLSEDISYHQARREKVAAEITDLSRRCEEARQALRRLT